jgi:ketosteroid isomerase-like protein
MVLVASGQVDQQLRREQEMIGADPEDVVRRWDSWATGRTGRPHDQKNIGVFTVRAGKIVNIREYADTQHWERALVAT